MSFQGLVASLVSDFMNNIDFYLHGLCVNVIFCYDPEKKHLFFLAVREKASFVTKEKSKRDEGSQVGLLGATALFPCFHFSKSRVNNSVTHYSCGFHVAKDIYYMS